MNTSPNIEEIASLIGEPSRVSMLVSLMGGKALPASELARLAKITPQTASTHLAKLVEGGFCKANPTADTATTDWQAPRSLTPWRRF